MRRKTLIELIVVTDIDAEVYNNLKADLDNENPINPLANHIDVLKCSAM